MCVRYVANGQILVYFGITSCYCIYLRFVIFIVYFCMYFLVLHDVVCISGETSVFWSSSSTLRLRLFAVVLMVFWRVRPMFVSCSCPSLSSIFGFFYVPNLLHKFQIRGRIVVGTERVLATPFIQQG